MTRSDRKSVAIYVRDGRVEVRAPTKMPERDIDRFVEAKEEWINDRLSQTRERMERREAFAPGYGDTIPYRGSSYPIVAKEGNRIGFDDTAFYIPPGLQPEHLKSACVQIYRLLAKRDLPLRTASLAEQMGVAPAAVKINGAKTRWGSCSTKKNINFSWYLIMAEDDLIDYVIVHELAHMTEMNHSARFWAIVGRVMPDYPERKARLAKLQKKISYEDWG